MELPSLCHPVAPANRLELTNQDEDTVTHRMTPPLLISFSGMDGAGKSTQIQSLRLWLRDAGLRVRVMAFWDDIAVFKGFRETSSHVLFNSEKGIGSPDKPVERRDKNVRAWYMTPARFLLYFADTLGLAVAIWKIHRQPDADVVIFDRYLDDELVNLNLKSRISRFYARFLLKISRRPDLALLLDADPESARARKPEYPLAFLLTIRNAYRELATLSGDVTVIPAGDVAAVESRIRERLEQRLADQALAPRPISLVG